MGGLIRLKTSMTGMLKEAGQATAIMILLSSQAKYLEADLSIGRVAIAELRV